MDSTTAHHAARRWGRGTTKAETMSIYPLLLEGWEDTSTWGDDGGHLYAQLTRNGISDDNGPEIWIAPPRYPVVRTAHELACVIAQATDCGQQAVFRGMATGATLGCASQAERDRLGLPNEPAMP